MGKCPLRLEISDKCNFTFTHHYIGRRDGYTDKASANDWCVRPLRVRTPLSDNLLSVVETQAC